MSGRGYLITRMKMRTKMIAICLLKVKLELHGDPLAPNGKTLLLVDQCS